MNIVDRLPIHGKEPIIPQLAGTVLLGMATLFAGGCDGAVNPTVVPTATATIPSLSTDWKVCGIVKNNKGIFETLKEAAGNQTPREMNNAGIKDQVYVLEKDGRIFTFTVEQALKNEPVVHPGDTVCQTTLPLTAAQMEKAAAGK